MTSPDLILILTGPPGAGKSTVAALIAERQHRAVHLECDRFFRFITSGYVEPWKRESHEQNQVVMDVVARAAAGYADGGYFTVIDGIVDPRWFLQPLRRRLQELGNRVAFAVLRPPLSVCLERAAARTACAPVEPKVVEQLWHAFADLGELESHVIEPRDSAEQTADLVASLLRDGVLTT